MLDITTVTKGDEVYALFYSKEIETDSIRFLTDESYPFQIGLMKRPAGYDVPAHRHTVPTREIVGTAEFLYIESGKIRATVYDDDWNELATKELVAGDFLLFMKGGHRVEWIEESRILEVKQGPFLGDVNEKTFKD